MELTARRLIVPRIAAPPGAGLLMWPFGSPDEVRAELRGRIDDFAQGGGFVFASVHNIQALVPPENIVAALDTARHYP